MSMWTWIFLCLCFYWPSLIPSRVVGNRHPIESLVNVKYGWVNPCDYLLSYTLLYEDQHSRRILNVGGDRPRLTRPREINAAEVCSVDRGNRKLHLPILTPTSPYYIPQKTLVLALAILLKPTYLYICSGTTHPRIQPQPQLQDSIRSDPISSPAIDRIDSIEPASSRESTVNTVKLLNR